MHNEICNELTKLEEEQDIRILYACESGSRAWGFASPDSDYDVRFVYVHKLDWYLSVEERRDVIDLMLPRDLDLSGWELRKMLSLFKGCNLALNEWIGSSVTYLETGFEKQMRALIPVCFNSRKAMYHYLSMSKRSYEKYWTGDDIGIKKLFYILRALLACEWISQFESMPPTSFHDMKDGLILPSELIQHIDKYLEQKTTANEGDRIKPSTWFANWCISSIATCEERAATIQTVNVFDGAQFDEILRSKVLGEE